MISCQKEKSVFLESQVFRKCDKRILFICTAIFIILFITKILQTKMLVTCQMFGDLFLFGLVWQYSTNQNRYNEGRFIGSNSWLLTCRSNITLSLPSYTVSAFQRELNFCNDYLSFLYFWYICFISSTIFFNRMYSLCIFSNDMLISHRVVMRILKIADVKEIL